VVAGRADNSLYVSFLHKSTVNMHKIVGKAGERDAAVSSGMDALLAADIEANYKSLTYPTVLPTALYNENVKNGTLLFTGVSSGTAGERVVVHSATAATATIVVTVSAHTATITLSDTASLNTATAIFNAWTSSTAAMIEAIPTLYLGTLSDGTSRNSGAGVVTGVPADVQVLQANTYALFGRVRMLHGNISTERGN
jgi:hypothetical protein